MKNRALGARRNAPRSGLELCVAGAHFTEEAQGARPQARAVTREPGTDTLTEATLSHGTRPLPPACPAVCSVQDSVSLRLCSGPAAGGPSRLIPQDSDIAPHGPWKDSQWLSPWGPSFCPSLHSPGELPGGGNYKPVLKDEREFTSREDWVVHLGQGSVSQWAQGEQGPRGRRGPRSCV